MYACLLDVAVSFVGMMSNVSENNSQLHLRHAQLQGDCNELEVSSYNISLPFFVYC